MSGTDRGTPLAGRTSLVTGAGNGLGRAIARELSAAGSRVVLVGRDRAKLSAVREELQGDAAVMVCDTSSETAVNELGVMLHEEEISILINNAGIGGPVASLTDTTVTDWDDVFATNVRGVFLMCREILPGMIRRGSGDIINLASVTGKRPLAGRTPYAASKMAVIGLTATLASEVGPLGITVNSLSPGPVDGPRMARNFRLEAERTHSTIDSVHEEFVSRSALRRMVTEKEVGLAVLAMLQMPGLCGADIDLSAGMIARS